MLYALDSLVQFFSATDVAYNTFRKRVANSYIAARTWTTGACDCESGFESNMVAYEADVTTGEAVDFSSRDYDISVDLSAEMYIQQDLVNPGSDMFNSASYEAAARYVHRVVSHP
jgi:hypothetical protein